MASEAPSPSGQAITLLVASSLTVLAPAIVAPALPGIERAFAQVPQVGLMTRLVLTLPALAIAVSAPLAGLLTDRLGRRATLLGGLVLFAVAGATGLVVGSMAGLLVGRAMLGFSVAAIMTAATTLISELYAGAERSRFLGWQAAFMGIGGLFFLVGGGALAELSWRSPFAIYLLALPVIPLVVRYLPEPERGGGSGANDEHVGPELPSTSVLACVYGLGLLGMMAFYLIPVQVPFYVEKHFGGTGVTAGISIGITSISSAALSLLFPRVRRALGAVGTLAWTFAAFAPGLLLIGLASSWWAMLPGLVLIGVGLGVLTPNLNTILSEQSSPAVRGRVLGGLAMFLFLGQFCSPLAAAPVIARGGFDGWDGVFALAAMITLVLFAVVTTAALAGVGRKPVNEALAGVGRKPVNEEGAPSPPARP